MAKNNNNSKQLTRIQDNVFLYELIGKRLFREFNDNVKSLNDYWRDLPKHLNEKERKKLAKKILNKMETQNNN